MVEIIALAIIIFIGFIAYKWVMYISGLLKEVTTWYEELDQSKPIIMPLRIKQIRNIIGHSAFRDWLEHLDAQITNSNIMQLAIEKDLDNEKL